MRFLADENVEPAVIRVLRGLGHTVLEVGQLRPGAADDEVISLARGRRCILATNDKDFGELVFLQGKRVPGVLLVRLPGRSGAEKAPIVRAAVQERGSRLARHFVVVEPGRTRSRPLRGG